ncbi:hypothetical protein BGZ65_010244 [Modicella reniformis]|uniref:Pentatricopeptide repeat-containing protein n=1 Tax=Modicella reniformis TaxID=1440133 RepID=A0A9P6M7T2_9FUNG|nr:hypothetical protein BGZ65_010244 [Modicella reniformis]
MVPEEERSLELVNRMIGGYMTLGLEEECEGLIQWLAIRKIKPNVETYNHILRHSVQQLSMPVAEGLVQRMQRGGIAPNVETWNLLIRGRELLDQRKLEGKKQGRKSRTYENLNGAEDSEKEEEDMMDDVKREERSIRSRSNSNSSSSSSSRGKRNSEDGGKKTTSVGSRPVFGTLEPNEMTVQLILSGFGLNTKSVQGQGDYTQALELYRNRVVRQTQQKELLLEGLASLRSRNSSNLSSTNGNRSKRSLLENDDHNNGDGENEGEEEEEEDGWMLDHVKTLQGLGALSDSDVGMTDVDWKVELKWEEVMEMEKERERDLSGR